MARDDGEVFFEVQIMQAGRWKIHSRYSAAQKGLVVTDARALDKISTYAGVKAVKEAYDVATGMTSESVVFMSERLKGKGGAGKSPAHPDRPSAAKAPARDKGRSGRAPKRAPRTGQTRRSAAAKTERKQTARAEAGTGQPDSEHVAEPNPAPPRKPRRFFGVLVKLLLIVLASVLDAALIMELAALFVRDKEIFGTVMSGTNLSNVLVAIFILAFVLCAGILTVVFIRKGDFDFAMGLGSSPSGARIDAAVVAEAPSESDAPPATKGTRRTAAPARARPAPKEPASPGGVLGSSETIETAPEAPAESLSPEGRTQSAVVLKFLGDALGHGETMKKAADAYGKFGNNLFMAGACEGLARSKNLDVHTASVILSDSLRTLGVKKLQADAFANRFNEYLLTDALYVQMYDAGRGAMNSGLEGDPSSVGNLEKALDQWNQPKAKEKRSGTVTVIFTDMVGSTSLTQSKGDAAAQQVVRLHNRIVRDALGKFAGNEVKHTGDGIMASFDQTSRGISTAIFIQRETAAHNSTDPELPLNLKIGINAGEPIAEDNDLFGSTVQLTARIVDQASAGDIFVSEAVHGICAGKEFRFASHGRFELKGITEPVTLYGVTWDEGAPEAKAPADEASGAVAIDDAPSKGAEGDVAGAAKEAVAADGARAPRPAPKPQGGAESADG